MGQRPPPRPQQPDTSSAKVIAAILFVVLLIVVLGQRILTAGLDEEPAAPDRSGRPGGGGTLGSSSLEIRYPKRCLNPAPPPEGLGVIAAERPEGVSVATPAGRPLASIRATGPVGWSPSGRFLATGRGDLWTASGAELTTFPRSSTAVWAWSPVADCIVGVDRVALTVTVPRQRGKDTVLSGDIATFAFSPSGTQLMVVIADRNPKRAGIWLADLKSQEMHLLLDAKESRGPWVLNGWSRAERPILMRPAGVTTGSGPPDVSFLPPGAATTCGDEIVVASGGMLATFGVTGPPNYLAADATYRYLAVTCAPNGEFLAAVRVLRGAGPDAARLVLLTRQGDFVRPLTAGLYRDEAPSWGPSGTGVVLVRRPLGASVGPQQLWIVPEGGVVQSVGLPVVGSDGGSVFDWSADGVPGHPIDR